MYKLLSTTFNMFDTFDNITTTPSSVILSISDFGLSVVPISTGIAFELILTNEILSKKVMNRDNM